PSPQPTYRTVWGHICLHNACRAPTRNIDISMPAARSTPGLDASCAYSATVSRGRATAPSKPHLARVVDADWRDSGCCLACLTGKPSTKEPDGFRGESQQQCHESRTRAPSTARHCSHKGETYALLEDRGCVGHVELCRNGGARRSVGQRHC